MCCLTAYSFSFFCAIRRDNLPSDWVGYTVLFICSLSHKFQNPCMVNHKDSQIHEEVGNPCSITKLIENASGENLINLQ